MTARFSTLLNICGLLLPILFLGCGSAQKQRLEMRDKASASSGLYCEFISGDVHSDIDVELNLQMARRCEPTKPLTMTNYKNSSENFGVIYCCSIKKDEKKPVVHASPALVPAKKNEDELDLSNDPETSTLGAPEKNAEKTDVPAKANPSTLNNPAASTNKPAAPANSPAATKQAAPPSASSATQSKPTAATSAASPAQSKPAASSTPAQSKPASSAPSATSSAKPANAAPQQNTAPKAPNKNPDVSDADILGD